jgi:hypothetical protein
MPILWWRTSTAPPAKAGPSKKPREIHHQGHKEHKGQQGAPVGASDFLGAAFLDWLREKRALVFFVLKRHACVDAIRNTPKNLLRARLVTLRALRAFSAISALRPSACGMHLRCKQTRRFDLVVPGSRLSPR